MAAYALRDVLRYRAKYPYLMLPENLNRFMQQVLSKEQWSKIEENKVQVDPSGLSPAELQEQQRQMDQLVGNFWKRIENLPDYRYGHVPGHRTWWGYFTSMFVHADFYHFLGNMLLLLLVGCALEDAWGRPFYFFFYLAGGIWAAFQHDLRNTESVIPIIGASGAIAAVMGAFLVRFYKSNIHFLIGTFSAPGFIALPIWLIVIFVIDRLHVNSGGAYWAHIDGLGFGAIVGVVITVSRFENRFVAPLAAETQSPAQNPMFLRAVSLSQQQNYIQARKLLLQVIQEEPDNVEALLAIRNIAEQTRNAGQIQEVSALLIESLIRQKEAQRAIEYFRQYRNYHLRPAGPLPAKTMLALAAFLERIPDFGSAREVYEAIAVDHSGDGVALKALVSSARICFEKVDQNETGVKLLNTAYHHPLANESWKSILAVEFQKYRITPQQEVSLPAAEPHTIDAMRLSEQDIDFDGLGKTIVPCRMESMNEDGILLKNEMKENWLLPWRQVYAISVGLVHLPGGEQARTTIVLDFVTLKGELSKRRLYRTYSQWIDFKKLLPRSAPGMQAFKTLIQTFLSHSNAFCIPDHEACTGPQFRAFGSLEEYQEFLQQALVAKLK